MTVQAVKVMDDIGDVCHAAGAGGGGQRDTEKLFFFFFDFMLGVTLRREFQNVRGWLSSMADSNVSRIRLEKTPNSHGHASLKQLVSEKC